MAGLWAKIHTSALSDLDLMDLDISDWGRWAKLVVYTKAHGDEGVLTVKAPGRGLQIALQVSSLEEIKAVCERLPNIDATQSESDLKIEFKNWGECQGPSDAAERMRRLRERQRNSEERRS